ncbi:MAG: hypothetical protein ACXAC7_02900 [Candidatus Hodarchaeales archaeon]|jgi:hypothetical protein
MASERFSLSHTADNVACEVRNELRKTVLTFFSGDGKTLGSQSFITAGLDEDKIVDLLAASNVEFTTFSALYDAAAVIFKKVQEIPSTKPSLFAKDKETESEKPKITTPEPQEEPSDTYIKPSERLKKEQELDKPEDEYVPSFMKMETEEMEDIEEIAEKLSQEFSSEIVEDQEIIDTPSYPFDTSDLGQFIYHYEIPSSAETELYFFCPKENHFAFVFVQLDKELYRTVVEDIPSEDEIYSFLQSSGVSENFVSMSVTFDLTDKITEVCKNPEKYQPIIEVQEDKKKEVSEVPEGKPLEVDVLFEFKIPYSEYRVDFYPSDTDPVEMTLLFLEEGKEIHRTMVEGIPTEDDAYNIVEETGITENFSSMSLIFDIAEKIIHVCSNIDDYRPEEEKIEEPSDDAALPIQSTDKEEATVVTKKAIIEPKEDDQEFLSIIENGVLLKELKIPYSHDTSVKIYFNEETGRFALQFWRGEGQVDQAVTDKSLDDDGAWEIFNKADIEFISMSVIYDASDNLIEVIQNPEKYLVEEKAAIGDEVDGEVGTLAVAEEEAPVDFDQFRGPEHIEPLMEAIKKSIGTDRPLLVKEDFIASMPKIGFKVFRQGEKIWSIDFFDKKSGETLSQRPFKLKKIEFDEVFSAVNNGIPQVSLSAVQDAAEYVFDVIKNLASRPADDLVFTQVIKHFEDVIDNHEKANEIDQAIELTNGLTNKLEELGNASGVSKFGIRIAKFYESEDRSADSARFRLDTIPKLITMGDTQALRDFVGSTIELFSSTNLNRPLDAASVSVDFAEYVLRRKELSLAMQFVTQASSFYKEANLPLALADHNFRYGKLFLQLLRGDEPEGFFDSLLISTSSEDSDSEDEADSDMFDLLADNGDPFADLEEEEEPEEDTDEKLDELDKETIESVTEEEINLEEVFGLRKEALSKLLDDIVQLFQGTIDVYEEGKDRFRHEILDSITETILLFRRYGFLEQEVIFADKGVKILNQNNQSDRALRLSLQLLDKLLVEDGKTQKALEFFNEAIRLYYSTKDFSKALDLSLNTVQKLVELQETDIAIQYIGFTNGVADQVFPIPSEEGIDVYLRLAEYYMSLKQQNESIGLLTKVLRFKKGNMEELLDFCQQRSVLILKDKKHEFARDFINAALQEIGNADLESIVKVSDNFSADLLDYEQFDLAMQYLTYAYQVAQSLPQPLERAGMLVIQATNRFIASKNLKKPHHYINSLIPILKAYFGQTQDFPLAIPLFQNIVDCYIETDQFSDAIEQAKDLSVYYQYNQELLKAGDLLITVRNKCLENDNVTVEVARELTDSGLKLILENSPDPNARGIEVLDTLIRFLLDKGQFEDAYVYTVQSMSYYEAQSSFEEAIVFVKDLRSIFMDKGQEQDATSLTSLMIRLNRQLNDYIQAAEIASDWYNHSIEKKQWETAFSFLMDAVNYYKKDSHNDEAGELLKKGYEAFIKEPQAEEEAKEIVAELVAFEKFINNITQEDELNIYLNSTDQAVELEVFSLSNFYLNKAIALVKQHFPDRFHELMTGYVQKLMDAERFKESQPYVSDLISAYHSDIQYVRELLFYYVDLYLKVSEVEIATRLVEVLLERIKGDSANIIRITMRFVQMLAEYRLTSRARMYIDSTVENLFPVAVAGDPTQNTAVATIYEKFASMVVNASPELAVEYGFKAIDRFSRLQNYEKIINIYTTLATQIEDPETALRILKRGTFQADQVKMSFSLTYNLYENLVYRSFETKSTNAAKDFQSVLSKFEENHMLNETIPFLQQCFYRMVRNNFFDLYYRFIDYFITLSKGIKTQSAGMKVVTQIAARYFRKKRDKTKVAKLKEIYVSLDEPDPEDELIKHFLKTGEIVLPEKPVIPERAELEPVVAELQTQIAEQETAEPEAIEEEIAEPTPEPEIVTPEAIPVQGEEIAAPGLSSEITLTTMEEDIDLDGIEIDGDALSAALSSALSQLSEELSEDIPSDIVEPETQPEISIVADVESPTMSETPEEESKEPLTEILPSPEIEDSVSSDFQEPLEDTSSISTKTSDEEEVGEEIKLEALFESALSDLTNMFGSTEIDLSKSEEEPEIAKPIQTSDSLDLPDPSKIQTKAEKLIGSGKITLEEEKIYLDITKKYNKLMQEYGFQQAVALFVEKLPIYLKENNITADEWEILSEKGDMDPLLQEYFESLE